MSLTDTVARDGVIVPVGWSDCGHGTWRTARILDPFAGRERVGMFLQVIDREAVA